MSQVPRDIARQREARAWKLRQSFWTQRRIAQELGIAQQTVSLALKRAAKRRLAEGLSGDSSQERLELLERQLERDLQCCARVGQVLATIRDTAVYLEHDASFAHYCRRRWCLERSQVYRLMAGARVAMSLRREESPGAN